MEIVSGVLIKAWVIIQGFMPSEPIYAVPRYDVEIIYVIEVGENRD